MKWLNPIIFKFFSAKFVANMHLIQKDLEKL